jgi:hypothetical protein
VDQVVNSTREAPPLTLRPHLILTENDSARTIARAELTRNLEQNRELCGDIRALTDQRQVSALGSRLKQSVHKCSGA